MSRILSEECHGHSASSKPDFFPIEWELPPNCCTPHEFSKDFPAGRWIVILKSRYFQLPIV